MKHPLKPILARTLTKLRARFTNVQTCRRSLRVALAMLSVTLALITVATSPQNFVDNSVDNVEKSTTSSENTVESPAQPSVDTVENVDNPVENRQSVDNSHDGERIPHYLPKEVPLPDTQLTTHFAKAEFRCDCASANAAQAGAEASADGQAENGQTADNLSTGADANNKQGYCDGFPATMDSDLLAKLEALRTALGRSVVITSGLRCATRNAEVGGIPDSRHLTGRAADLYCPGVPYTEVARLAREQGLWVLEYPEEQYVHVEV